MSSQNSRRRFVRGLVLVLVLVLFGACDRPATDDDSAAPVVQPPTRYFDAATEAVAWIESQARATDPGRGWGESLVGDWQPPDGVPLEVFPWGHGMYKGTSGVVRFFVDAYRVTGDATYLEAAVAGADFMLASLPETVPSDPDLAGLFALYGGWGGVLWTLEEVHRASGEARFRAGALLLLDHLVAMAQPGEVGVHWGETNELFYGNAGVGLLLLWAAETYDRPDLVDLAEEAARWLLTTAEPREGGVTWSWGSEQPDLVMPNFSHGTSGVAYFLAALHRVTGEAAYLDAALEGAGHLTAVAETGDDGRFCLVFHHEDTEERHGEDRYYLGFCHGPVGTSRLFEQLYLATGESHWRDWVDRGTTAIAESGIPAEETGGFWNNVSQCCGSAGVIDHFVDQYLRTGEERYLDFARRMADDLLTRGTEEGSTLRWVQAEHRVQPDLLEAQIGYMQGAAGIAAALFHLDAAIRGLDVERVRFVDDPW